MPRGSVDHEVEYVANKSCEESCSTMPLAWASYWRLPLSEDKSLAFCIGIRMR